MYFQIVIGGITRLTGSGLSITKWEIVTGTIPPLNQKQWKQEFELYKNTPQYKKINAGMSLQAFKRIYFWEYLHRVWARGMGFVFIIPFTLFLAKGWLDRALIKRLLMVVFLAAIVATFGWIMVASGLIERPWVNAYKLSIHLCLALLLYAYLLWTFLGYRFPTVMGDKSSGLTWYIGLLAFQIFLGGLMSGMKASLLYPSFPDYNGFLFPQLLLVTESWNVQNIWNYDATGLAPTLVQFLHRTLGYLLVIFGLWLARLLWRRLTSRRHRIGIGIFIFLLVTQVLLGISVLINSIAQIPVFLGVLHQAVAILLLTSVIFLYYFDRKNSVLPAS